MKKKEKQIDWRTWWPFKQATGDALKQLNKLQPKQKPTPATHGEALL